jgi:hypothetical protein
LFDEYFPGRPGLQKFLSTTRDGHHTFKNIFALKNLAKVDGTTLQRKKILFVLKYLFFKKLYAT